MSYTAHELCRIACDRSRNIHVQECFYATAQGQQALEAQRQLQDAVVATPSKKERKMFDYLQPRDGPVIDGLEQHEVVLGKDQPEYVPLRALVGRTLQQPMLSRFTFTPEQRQAIANGADLFLNQLTFGDKFHPISVAIGDTPNPDYFREAFALPGSAAGDRMEANEKLFEQERANLRRRIANDLGTA